MGVATPIHLTDDERGTLEMWVRRTTSEQRMVQRARIVLAAAAGKRTKEVAALVQVRPATVSRWRIRFAQHHIAGLADAPRPGKPLKYEETTEQASWPSWISRRQRVTPGGRAAWWRRPWETFRRLQVWRVLQRHGIHLQRRRSGCVSTDPQFTQKAADIVGLYWDPPENAVVISVDERTAIQALERAQGWLRLPNGQAVWGRSREYQRHGTTTLFAALEVHTGVVAVGPYRRRRRREFLDSLNRVVVQHPDTALHVILDNLSTHKPKHDRWLAHHPLVHFHDTPTHASWLNQVEVWFSILTQAVLRSLSATNPHQVRQSIDKFTDARHEHPVPFEWTRSVVHPGDLKTRYVDLR